MAFLSEVICNGETGSSAADHRVIEVESAAPQAGAEGAAGTS